MKNYIEKSFDFNGVKLRIADGDIDNPWFYASDICDILGIINHRQACENLDDDERGVSTRYTLGGEQTVLVVNESGLYSLIFVSRKKEARVFRKWVTSEVLPSIRRTGVYNAVIDAIDNRLELIVQEMTNRQLGASFKKLSRKREMLSH